jgi:anti-anti-sigma regulatory factor
MNSVVVRFSLVIVVMVAALIGLDLLMSVLENRRRARFEPQEFRLTGSDIQPSFGSSPNGTFSITERRLTRREYRSEHFEPFSYHHWFSILLDDAFLATHEIDHVVVLDLIGALLLSESDEILAFRRRIGELLDRGERIIALNLTSFTEIGAAGLGELVRAWTLVYRQGGAMGVVNAPRFFKNLMAMVR